ncbi:MAG: PqqD family protein [Acidimicrobiales bacterium]
MSRHGVADDAFVPRVRPEAPSVELDGQVVVYDPVRDELLTLNDTASVVWSCCDGSGTVGEIVADLAEAYAAEVPEIRKDVVALLQEWGGRGLLEGVEPSP